MVGDDGCRFCRTSSWSASTGEWTVAPAANSPAVEAFKVISTEEFVFFQGGLDDKTRKLTNTAGLLERNLGTWTGYNPPLEGRRSPYTSLFWTGSEFAIWGGYQMDDENAVVTEDSSPLTSFFDGEFFNPVSRQWRAMPAARPEGHHVWGKNPPDGHMTSVWTSAGLFVWGMTPEEDASWGAIFDQQSETWRDVSSKGAPPPRRYQASLTLGGDVYVFSGRPPAGGEYSRRLWRYSLSQDTWHELDVPDYASPYKGSVVGGKLAFLGDCAAGTLYDPNRNAWELLSPVGAPTSRDGVMRTVGDVITITGVYEGEQEISDVHVLDLAP